MGFDAAVTLFGKDEEERKVSPFLILGVQILT